MQEFNDILFMGNGDHSLSKIEKLRQLFEEGLTTLSGLQQPPRPESEEATKLFKIEIANNRCRMNEITQDIVTALLGKNFVVVSRQEVLAAKHLFWRLHYV